MTGRLTVVDHPLVAHKITLLRDVATTPSAFRTLCTEVTLLTAYEALRHLPTEDASVTTPLVATRSPMLAGPGLAVVGILRAGLVMIEAMLTLLPQARVGHIGIHRDHDTHRPVGYYCKLPPDVAEREVVLVDPMLATGGSAVHALDLLAEHGCRPAKVVSIIGCPEGVRAVHERHPEVDITVAALDERLDENAYIVPGLGDAGDRIYGTPQ
ncbi:MAG: uracil phosphoribosyltransferase [Acidimicrobiales bacterium]